MPTYQFLLHTTGIRLDPGDGEPPSVGFYTSRRAKAATPEEAYKLAMAEMDADPDLQDIFQSGIEAGLRPNTVVEETHMIPWWRAILPWRKPELFLYPDDPDDGDGEPSHPLPRTDV